MNDQSEGEKAETFERAVVHILGCIGKVGLIHSEWWRYYHMATNRSWEVHMLWVSTVCVWFCFGAYTKHGYQKLSDSYISTEILDGRSSFIARKRGVSAATLSDHESIGKDLLASDTDLGLPGKYSPGAVIGSAMWREKCLPLLSMIDDGGCGCRWWSPLCLQAVSIIIKYK
jgi:hypothetical protein